MIDSLWCEGNADGDGTGESVVFDFGQSVQVSKLQMRNGSAGSFKDFMATNRAKAAKLTFSDGSSDVPVKTSMMEQTIRFQPRTLRRSRSPLRRLKGSSYNDLCIAEARFLP